MKSSSLKNLKVKIPSIEQEISTANVKEQQLLLDNYAKINESIFIGNYEFASDLEKMKEEGITHIINCSPDECQNIFQEEDDIIYIDVLMEEEFSADILQAITIILEFIEEAIEDGGKVLISSQMGISRAPTIALGYLISKQQFSLKDAITELRIVYPKAQPNLDFEIQLLDFQNQLQEKLEEIKEEQDEEIKNKQIQYQQQNRRNSIKRLNSYSNQKNHNVKLLEHVGGVDMEESEFNDILFRNTQQQQNRMNLSNNSGNNSNKLRVYEDDMMGKGGLIKDLEAVGLDDDKYGFKKGNNKYKSQNTQQSEEDKLLDEKKRQFIQKSVSMGLQGGKQTPEQIMLLKNLMSQQIQEKQKIQQQQNLIQNAGKGKQQDQY